MARTGIDRIKFLLPTWIELHPVHRGAPQTAGAERSDAMEQAEEINFPVFTVCRSVCR